MKIKVIPYKKIQKNMQKCKKVDEEKALEERFETIDRALKEVEEESDNVNTKCFLMKK